MKGALRILLVLVTTLGLSVYPATAVSTDSIVSVGQLFNSGVNLGWLIAAIDTGLFPAERPGFAANSAAHFNAGIAPSPAWSSPGIDRQDASNRWEQQKQKVGYASNGAATAMGRAAPAIMDAGFLLGAAHINAQKGTCPSCVRMSTYNAGQSLRYSRVSVLEGIGDELMALARRMETAASIEDVQFFINPLADAITTLQGML